MFKRLMIRFLKTYISTADSDSLDQLMLAAMQRYHTISPDYEIHFLSLPMDPEEQIQYYERIIELLKAHPVETK